MVAHIRLSGSLRDLVQGLVEVEVAAGQTVRDAIQKIGLAPEIIAMVVVNETQESKDYIIKDGDVVRLRAIIGGG